MTTRSPVPSLPIRVLSMVALWLVTIAVFWRGLWGEFVWDDVSLVLENASLRDPGRLLELLTSGFFGSSQGLDLSESYARAYRPVTALALLGQYQAFGPEAVGFHVVSLLVHLAVVTFVLLILRRILEPASGAWFGALVGALLFAVHPSRAESVSWISGSSELWMALFWFAGYLCWLAGHRWLVLSATLFGLSFLSKGTAIVIPLLLLVDMHAREGFIRWRAWAVVTGVVSLCAALRLAIVPPPTMDGDWAHLPARVVATLGYYVEAIVWPWAPYVQRGFRVLDCKGAMVVPSHIWVFGGLATAGLLSLCFSWSSARGRGYAADIGWIVVPLLPVLNFWDVHAHAFAADRCLYVPMFGVAALVARAVAALLLLRQRVFRTVLLAALAFVLSACALSTRRHVAHFHDSETLWRYEVKRNPNNLYAVERVAQQHSAARDFEEGLRWFQQGYERATVHCDTAGAARFALSAAGQLVRKTQDTEQSNLRDLRRFYGEVVNTNRLHLVWPELKIDMELPDGFAEELDEDPSLVALPRALVTMRTLDLDRAEALLEEVLDQDRYNDGARLSLATVYARQGRWSEARALLDQANTHIARGPSAERLSAALSTAEELAHTAAATEREQRIRDARVQVLLGAPEAARRVLEPELGKAPGEPEVVLEYVAVMIADRRFDLAGDVIENASMFAPEHEDTWNEMRRATARAREHAIEPRRPGSPQR